MTVNENLKLLENALLSIIKMDNVATLDEQLDAVYILSKIRTKLKEELKNEQTAKN